MQKALTHVPKRCKKYGKQAFMYFLHQKEEKAVTSQNLTFQSSRGTNPTSEPKTPDLQLPVSTGQLPDHWRWSPHLGFEPLQRNSGRWASLPTRDPFGVGFKNGPRGLLCSDTAEKPKPRLTVLSTSAIGPPWREGLIVPLTPEAFHSVRFSPPCAGLTFGCCCVHSGSSSRACLGPSLNPALEWICRRNHVMEGITSTARDAEYPKQPYLSLHLCSPLPHLQGPAS